jgi:threonine/homoserine/homoserine lactone efflux protein
MNLLDFGIEVIALSASGVLTPGPLFFANLAYGTHHDKWSGIKIAYGHTAVELPLIIILAAGLFTFDTAKKYASVVGLIGGIAILAFAGLQIASIIKEKRRHDTSSIAGNKGPFIVGIALSALNPFFILWWFTVGSKLIVDSLLRSGSLQAWPSFLRFTFGWTMHGLPALHILLQREPLFLSQSTTRLYFWDSQWY